MHDRKIPYYKPTGGRALFLLSDIETFIERSRKNTDYELSAEADSILNANRKKQKVSLMEESI